MKSTISSLILATSKNVGWPEWLRGEENESDGRSVESEIEICESGARKRRDWETTQAFPGKSITRSALWHPHHPLCPLELLVIWHSLTSLPCSSCNSSDDNRSSFRMNSTKSVSRCRAWIRSRSKIRMAPSTTWTWPWSQLGQTSMVRYIHLYNLESIVSCDNVKNNGVYWLSWNVICYNFWPAFWCLQIADLLVLIF